jgi:serine/threonine-protein kinase
LRALLDRGALLSTSQALVVGLEAARALDAAHRRGFVHRDIKPANLLFGEDGRLRIADFGLARALSEAGWTEPGDGLVGTARYAAPEQAQGGRVDGKADVYALALVLIESITGEVPLTSSEGALQTMMARQATSVPVPDGVGPLREVLGRMGRLEPTERPDAAEVGRAFVSAARDLPRPGPLPLAGESVEQPADDITLFPDGDRRFEGDDVTIVHRTDETGYLPPVPTKRRRRGRWVVALLVVAALLGGGGAYAWTRLIAPTAVVPTVLGLPYDKAVAQIEATDEESSEVDWTIVREEDFSDDFDAGQVMQTRPGGKSRAGDGDTITLVVSKGPAPVKLPANLMHLGEGEIEATLAAAKFVKGTRSQVYDETVPVGQVIGWKVGGATNPTEAPKGATVDYTVSAGPEPRTIGTFTGSTPEQVEAELAKVGLKTQRDAEFSDSVAEGKVTRTSPAAGQKAARGDTVTIFVSKGQDLVTVPDVSKYSTLDQAEAALEAAGLELGEVSGRGTRPASSDPAAGQRVKRGTSVDIFLRR